MAESANDGTIADRVGRVRALAEAGVHHPIVSAPPVATFEGVERFAEVMAGFR